MNKNVSLFAVFVIFSLFVYVIVVTQPVEAKKAQGTYVSKYGAATKNIVCGNMLCSEIEKYDKVTVSQQNNSSEHNVSKSDLKILSQDSHLEYRNDNVGEDERKKTVPLPHFKTWGNALNFVLDAFSQAEQDVIYAICGGYNDKSIELTLCWTDVLIRAVHQQEFYETSSEKTDKELIKHILEKTSAKIEDSKTNISNETLSYLHPSMNVSNTDVLSEHRFQMSECPDSITQDDGSCPHIRFVCSTQSFSECLVHIVN